MSYAVYVVRFDHGEPVGLSAEAFAEVFGPHVTETQPQFHFHRVVAADDGDAEIYADLDPPFDSLSFGRFSSGDVCETLVRFAHRCDAPILLPEGIAMKGHSAMPSPAPTPATTADETTAQQYIRPGRCVRGSARGSHGRIASSRACRRRRSHPIDS